MSSVGDWDPGVEVELERRRLRAARMRWLPGLVAVVTIGLLVGTAWFEVREYERSAGDGPWKRGLSSSDYESTHPPRRVTGSGRHRELVVEYRIVTSELGPALRFVTRIPRDVPGLQTILESRFDPPPLRIDHEGEHAYAYYAVPSDGRVALVTQEFDVICEDGGEPERGFAQLERSGDWLRSEEFIESDDYWIRELAEGARAEGRAELVLELAGIVMDRLRPSGRKDDRRGAKRALDGVSSEPAGYADLLTALCRARGIAARSVVGFAPHRHIWNEVRLAPGRWMTVDAAAADGFDLEPGALPHDYVRTGRLDGDPVLGGHEDFLVMPPTVVWTRSEFANP